VDPSDVVTVPIDLPETNVVTPSTTTTTAPSSDLQKLRSLIAQGYIVIEVTMTLPPAGSDNGPTCNVTLRNKEGNEVTLSSDQPDFIEAARAALDKTEG